MDERTALGLLAETLPGAGDDAAVVDGLVVTTDMLHERADFPAGVTRYTAGWRAVGASLSDVAAMGAEAVATVAVYGAPSFDEAALLDFVRGAREVSELVDAAYVGGDLDHHDEFTVASAAVGRTDSPVYRSGASPGEVVCVTGTLGRTGAALRLFEAGEADHGNELFRFEPRVGAALGLAPFATAMMDSSDGLARSLHQLAEASGCGFAVESDRLPLDDAVVEVATDRDDELDLGVFVGEDFELVCTLAADDLDRARAAIPTRLTEIGTVTGSGVELDAEALADSGYTHEGDD